MAVAKSRWQRCNPQQGLDPGHFQAKGIKVLRVSLEAACHFGANVQSCYGSFFGGMVVITASAFNLISFPSCLARGCVPQSLSCHLGEMK